MPRKPKSPAEPPARHNRPRVIADLVGRVGERSFRRFGFVQAAILERWSEIVGEQYARHCRPISLKPAAKGSAGGGTLAIAATGALAPMIAHVEAQIIERVNRVLGHGAVARITVSQGRSMTPRLAPAPAHAAPLPEATQSTLKDIADPELRTALESLAQALAGSRGPPRIG
jgi:hypothetical protein